MNIPIQCPFCNQREEELNVIRLENDALIHDNLELSETIERLRIRITELEDRNGYHLRQFDAAIRRVATALGGVVCGGVDTEDNINPDTGQPYGPGGHTGWVLAGAAEELNRKEKIWKFAAYGALNLEYEERKKIIDDAAYESETVILPIYEKTYCSQCGCEFGPGNHGYSHCEDHKRSK